MWIFCRFWLDFINAKVMFRHRFCKCDFAVLLKSFIFVQHHYGSNNSSYTFHALPACEGREFFFAKKWSRDSHRRTIKPQEL